MQYPRLKVFILASFISGLISFPQNIIGCGPMMDPYDYFTSFYSKALVDIGPSKPYFYTNLLTFYDDWDYTEDSTAFINDALIAEWQTYVPGASKKDVVDFVYNRSVNEVKQLQAAMRQPAATIAPALKRNSMAMQLLQQKKTEAVQYLLLAKAVEPICVSPDPWSDGPKRDSAGINQYINQATAAWQKTTDAFLKNKYAFLRCKLAFYNNRFNDCTRWYAEGFDDNNTTAVKTMALSYSAGAQFKTGKGKEAAYAFSKTFAQTAPKHRKAVFLGFLWATDQCNISLLNSYCSVARTPKEQAMMAAMFGLWGYDYHLPVIEKVYQLDPQCELLPLLVLREINKVEERFLTPMLDKQPGSKAFYYSWNEKDTAALSDTHVQDLIALLEKMGSNPPTNHQSAFATATAYLHYMRKDVTAANNWLAKAKAMPASNAVKDQQQMVGLLIQTASLQAMNSSNENALLPQLKWLQQQAEQSAEFGMFYRNLMAQVIAPAYYQQGDLYKTVLAYGLADKALKPDSSGYTYYGYTANAIEFLQNKLNTPDIIALYDYLNNTPATAYDAFLMSNNSVTKDAVTDMLGTTYLREFDFAKAIDWLKKQHKPSLLTSEQYNYKTYKTTLLNVNPFHDYLNDWQRYEKPLAKPMSKLAFAEKMLRLQQAIDTASSNAVKSKLYYQLANGLYNMSYYGNSWMLMAYNRPNSNWNSGKYDAAWEKEYYAVHTAKNYYLKAYELSPDKEFKAAAYFLAAKCAQRQIARPDYDWNNYDAYEANMKVFLRKFANNAMFANFKKEFGSTKFYQFAYTRCSYLRDFAVRSK
ncbi:MAG: hypothetical protein LCH58_02415 [Bacteroidetes bacterium]|uniref:hypothetical protein n=1 Tax=Phnomibacter sp. TaxID=2836217 RepID=UPI002FDDA510|nr:hypothetical protein [Bacteroidota bacterium]